MMKFVRNSLITAGVFAALGIVLCLISAIFGGRNLIYFIHNDAYMDEKISKLEYFFDKEISKLEYFFDKFGKRGVYLSWTDKEPHELVVNDEVMTVAGMESHQSMEGIRNLSLTLGAGSLILREKNADDGMMDIYVQGRGGCDYRVKNGTLYVEGFKGLKVIGTDISENVITLVIPEGIRFEEVDIEVGAGVMEIAALKAGEVDAVVGVGELMIGGMQAKEFEAEIGAGILEAHDMETENTSLTISMGECLYRGAVLGNMEIECDMGNMELELKGHEKDFNYEIECAAGNVDIGDFSYTALASERKISNGCHRNIEIECNMGNVEIRFSE